MAAKTGILLGLGLVGVAALVMAGPKKKSFEEITLEKYRTIADNPPAHSAVEMCNVLKDLTNLGRDAEASHMGTLINTHYPEYGERLFDKLVQIPPGVGIPENICAE